jgi:hypothetical protein
VLNKPPRSISRDCRGEDKLKRFGRGFWNGFTGFFYEAILVPVGLFSTRIEILLSLFQGLVFTGDLAYDATS